MIPIKNRIRQAMNEKRIKQADLVRATGISKSTISGYLSGRYIPRQSSIYKLAQALNVSIEWLMGFDAQKYSSKDYYYEKCIVLLNSLDDEKIKKAYRTLLIEFDRLRELKEDV